MKNIKKIFSLMIAFVMMFGLALTTVRAEDFSYNETPNGSITINNPIKNGVYKLYKILDATFVTQTTSQGTETKTETTAVSYKVNDTKSEGKKSWLEILNQDPNTVTNEDEKKLIQQFQEIFTIYDTTTGAVKLNSEKGYTDEDYSDSTEETKLKTALKLLAERVGTYLDKSGKDIVDPIETKTVADDQSSLVFDKLGYGYYFITSGTGVIVLTGSVTPNLEIDEKNSFSQVEKTVSNSNSTTTDYREFADAQVGDTLDFQIVVPRTQSVAKEVTITDTMSSGLLFCEDWTTDKTVLEIKAGSQTTLSRGAKDDDGKITKTGDYYLKKTVNTTTGEITLEIELDENGRKLLSESNLTITYQAKVTDAALTTNQSNSAYYNLNVTPSDTPILTAFELPIWKYGLTEGNSTNMTALSGVGFEIYQLIESAPNSNTYSKIGLQFNNSNGIYTYASQGDEPTELFTNTSGYLRIKGLKAGTKYILKEKTPKEGYNIPAKDLVFEITESSKEGQASNKEENYTRTISNLGYPVEENGSITIEDSVDGNYTKVDTHTDSKIDVLNTTGAQLPSTGGSGTTMMYIAGGALLIGAVVLMITRKRVSE